MRVKQQYEDVVGRIKEAQTNQKIKKSKHFLLVI